MMNQTILITGGAGYIGSHAAWACVDHGRRVVVLDDMSAGVHDIVPPAATVVEGDAGDAELVSRLIRTHRVAAILHFAGSVVVPASVVDPARYYRNNTLASFNLIRAAVDGGVRALVFSSTAAVYAPVGSGRLAEASPLAPLSPYGRSKLMTEQMLADIGATSGLRYAVLRYFNVAGADPLGRTGQSTREATHLIRRACQVALGARFELPIFGDDYETPDGTCVRDYVHVSDLADAHLLAVEHLERGGASHTLNCGYGTGASVREVIAAVERATGRPLAQRVEPRRAGDAPLVVADNRALVERLRWSPRFAALDEIVRSALAWERDLAAAPPSRASGT